MSRLIFGNRQRYCVKITGDFTRKLPISPRRILRGPFRNYFQVPSQRNGAGRVDIDKSAVVKNNRHHLKLINLEEINPKYEFLCYFYSSCRIVISPCQ